MVRRRRHRFRQRIRALREKHVAEAGVDDIRKACLSFPSKTAIGLDQHVFTDIALLPDNALDSLGEIIRQCFVKLAIPTQSHLQLLVLLGKKMEGAELPPSCTQHYRLTMCWVSALSAQSTLGGGHRVGPQGGSMCDPFSLGHAEIP